MKSIYAIFAVLAIAIVASGCGTGEGNVDTSAGTGPSKDVKYGGTTNPGNTAEQARTD